MDKKVKKIIKSSTKKLMEMMGFDCKISVDEIEDEKGVNIICNIVAKGESNFIIDQDGDNLQAIQHLIRLIVRKQSDEKIRFTIDVNNYKKEKNDSILYLAKNMAEKVIKDKKAVVLKPMSAYERRLVHMELDEFEGVKTESINEGEERKIVIKLSE